MSKRVFVCLFVRAYACACARVWQLCVCSCVRAGGAPPIPPQRTAQFKPMCCLPPCHAHARLHTRTHARARTHTHTHLPERTNARTRAAARSVSVPLVTHTDNARISPGMSAVTEFSVTEFIRPPLFLPCVLLFSGRYVPSPARSGELAKKSRKSCTSNMQAPYLHSRGSARVRARAPTLRAESADTAAVDDDDAGAARAAHQRGAATRRAALQRGAVRCNVVRCVATWCGALHWLKHRAATSVSAFAARCSRCNALLPFEAAACICL